MKWILALTTVAAAVTLALIIGQRMSTDAMAIAFGVVFGVAASIPTSLIVVLATRSRPRDTYRPPEHPPQPGQPQVVIMPGPVGQRNPWLNSGLPQQQLPQPPADFYKTQPDRRFKVVGEDEHWLDAED